MIVRKTLAEVRAARLTPKQQARLDALTDAQITAAAKADPDNPPITAAEFKRMRRPSRRYFAIVHRGFGYALDYYPAERARHWQENRRHIIGDFATRAEADEAVAIALATVPG